MTFREALSKSGLSFDATAEIDGRIHRFTCKPDHEANCWYVLNQFGDLVVGAYGCWKRQIKCRYSSKDQSAMSVQERADCAGAWAEAERARAVAEQANQALVRSECNKLFAGGTPVESHPYLTRKEVRPFGQLAVSTRELTPGWLALALRDVNGTIHSAQFVADNGEKRFWYKGRVAGCYFAIAPDSPGPLVICEGYATGASIHMATGWPVCCALSCGNLAQVAKDLRAEWPDRTIVIAADNDQWTDGNPGKTKALAAAKTIKALVAIPEFSDEGTDKPTDFNDLQLSSGLDEVRRQIRSCFPVISFPIGDLRYPPLGDPTELLKYRFLCERGSLLMPGPSGIGKSSFVLQCFALWSLGLPAFGICPTRPLVCLLIQAENDEGDLAEMRDGVASGLKFDADQRAQFFRNVEIHTSTGIVGPKFCSEVVQPLLDLGRFNLFAIDPALSFIGGDVKEQKIVGDWLRVHLNPVVYEHNCASVMVHHTNKPVVGREKPDWRNGEIAYTGSGSAEWTNWARAILALQGTGEHGLYRLHAAKRGARLGWKDDQGQLCYEKTITHSQVKGQICWFETTPAVREIIESKAGRHNQIERIVRMDLKEFIAGCPPTGEGLRETARRLESWLAKRHFDASASTCVRSVRSLVDLRKLRKVDNHYLPPEPPTTSLPADQTESANVLPFDRVTIDESPADQ